MLEPVKNEAFFWKKKEFLSFVLSILVFFIHISSFSQYNNSNSIIGIINGKASYFFRESITRFAVPMFFMLSGIAFYKGYENKKYFQKLKSRLFSLVIPYLLWNTIWTVFDIVCSYTFIANYFIGRKPFDLTLLNILKGIFFYGTHEPFWFVFDLIVFAIAAPLIFAVIRNKYIGIATVIALSVLASFNIGLPSVIFFSKTAIIFYLIGAIIGKHFFNFISQKSNKGIQWGSLVFLAVYIIAKNVFPPQYYIKNTVLGVAVFTLCSYALWNIADLFIERVKPCALYTRSFAIFAMHMNVSGILTKIFVLCLPKTEWLAIPNFLITVYSTLLCINLVCTVTEKYFPRTYAIFMGNRKRLSQTQLDPP